MKYLVKPVIFITLFLIGLTGYCQVTDIGPYTYQFSTLTQEPISVTAAPIPSMPRESGDTSFTIYEGGSVQIEHFFVNGEQYDNIFNPYPTGVVLNGTPYDVFCDDELAVRQQVNMFLDVREFNYLGRDYVAFISLWENCDGATCRYRCYNVFDITDQENIFQYSFNSIFEGMDSFGEFNNDGVIDFLRAAPHPTEESKENGTADNYYYITAYTMKEGKTSQLVNNEHSNYYLYGYGDDLVSEFELLEGDWFFAIKDGDGNLLEKSPYFAPYISFDPYESYLYDADGYRQEKRRYSIWVSTLGDVEGAINEVEELTDMLESGVYILPDQYSDDITFRIMIGNFASKDLANSKRSELASQGIEGEIYDFQKSW
jgi:hypothetical protein